MPIKYTKNPTHGTHNKQQTSNIKTVYKKNSNRQTTTENRNHGAKIILDKTIQSVARFSPVLQQLARNR